jgi:hypothetical protein
MQSCLPLQLAHAGAQNAVLAAYNTCGSLRNDFDISDVSPPEDRVCTCWTDSFCRRAAERAAARAAAEHGNHRLLRCPVQRQPVRLQAQQPLQHSLSVQHVHTLNMCACCKQQAKGQHRERLGSIQALRSWIPASRAALPPAACSMRSC